MATNKIDDDAARIAKELEEEYGVEVLLKVSFSALSKLLVNKGIITRHDLNNYFIQFAEVAKKEIEGV